MSKTKRRLPEARNTSKSGGSRKSTHTPDKSRESENSSPTAEAWSETFGRTSSKEEQRLQQLLRAAVIRLADWEAKPAPNVALYRVAHKQTGARLKKHVERLREALTAEQDKPD